MGEDKVYPTVPDGEILSAKVPEGGAVGRRGTDGMAGAGCRRSDRKLTSIIAQEEGRRRSGRRCQSPGRDGG